MRCKNVPTLARMSWWGEKAEAVAESAAIAAPVVDREAEALSRVRELKAQLNELDAAMLKFKRENKITTDRFGRLLGCHCSTITGKARVETEWRALLTKRDRMVNAWHKALHEWSEAKMEAQRR